MFQVSHVLIPRSGNLRRKQEDANSQSKLDPVQETDGPGTRCDIGTHSPALPGAGAGDDLCKRNLFPAAVPSDPMETPGRSALPGLAVELAWIVEETCYLLPPTAEKDTCELAMPILLEYAWRHASLGLRQLLLTVFGQEVQDFRFDVTLATSQELAGQLPTMNAIEGTRLVSVDWDQNELDTLRSEARGALRLRFRRSDRIERDLNTIVGMRWRAAVEELGDVNDPNYVPRIKHRRKRKRNSLDELFKLAGNTDCDDDSDAIANRVPLELNAFEEELAWLTEESLLLLNDSSAAKEPRNASEILVTKSVDSDINWKFVLSNASESLRTRIERVGTDRRYPLQRLIRQHDPDVQTSFAKRRDDIAGLLVLKAYRRNQTRTELPSQEDLASTGFDKVLSIRLLRRRQICATKEIATNEDLIDACNQRLPTPAKKTMRQLVKKQAGDVAKPLPSAGQPLGSIANLHAAYRRIVPSIERMVFEVIKLTSQSPLGLQLCLSGRSSMKIKHVGPGPFTHSYLKPGCIIDVVNGKTYNSFREGVTLLKEAVGRVQIIASTPHGVQYGGMAISETQQLLNQMTERASHEILSAMSRSERRDIQNKTQVVAQVMAIVGFPDRECQNPYDQRIIIEACQRSSSRVPAMSSPKSEDHTTRLALTERRPQATRAKISNKVSESSKQDEQSAGSSSSVIDFTSSDESSAHAGDDDEDYEQEEESEDDDQDEDY